MRPIALCGSLALALALAPAGAGARRAPRCQAEDQFIPIAHGDGGGVWLPREVACGGAAPLVVMLHGNNGSATPHVSLAGGRNLERLARELIDQRLARPVILAEPVHFRICGAGLYDDGFDFPGYRDQLLRVLAARRIRVVSVSVAGHSGAGCCGGVFRAAEAFGPLRIFGLIDTCYGDDEYARQVHEHFDGRGTIVFHASRGEAAYAHYREFESQLLGPVPVAIACDTTTYRRCLRSTLHPYYSFATATAAGGYHEDIPRDYYRTLLTRFFPPEAERGRTRR